MTKDNNITFIRKHGKVIPIRKRKKQQKTAKLHASNERVKIQSRSLKIPKGQTKYEKSTYKASYFKPSNTFLGRLFDTHASEKDYKFMKKKGLRLESVGGTSVFVRLPSRRRGR